MLVVCADMCTLYLSVICTATVAPQIFVNFSQKYSFTKGKTSYGQMYPIKV